MGKVFGAALLILGCLTATLYAIADWSWAESFTGFLTENVLGSKGFLP